LAPADKLSRRFFQEQELLQPFTVADVFENSLRTAEQG
jgi:hypothetical protein